MQIKIAHKSATIRRADYVTVGIYLTLLGKIQYL